MKRKTKVFIFLGLLLISVALVTFCEKESAGKIIGAVLALVSLVALIVLLVKSLIDVRKNELPSKYSDFVQDNSTESVVQPGNNDQSQRQTMVLHQHNFIWSAWQHIEGSVPPSHCRYGTCSCGETQREQSKCIISVIDHRDATETEDGYRVYSCPDCGYSFTETIPVKSARENAIENDIEIEIEFEEQALSNGTIESTAINHQHLYEWSAWQHIDGSAPPTHYRVGVCSCGDTKREQGNCSLSVTDHHDATETEDGYRVYSCPDCGFSFNEIIPNRSAGKLPFIKTVGKGVYTERLSTGGQLRVSEYGWSIDYYFPGPDLRYKGTFFSVEGKDIELYKQAWKNNFERYKIMKEDIPASVSFMQEGEMGMNINVGGYYDGVCLVSHYMPIRTDDMLRFVISDYDYAESTAREIMDEWSKNS